MFKLLFKIYNLYYKNKFYYFGSGSVIKPFLNTSNPKNISIKNNVEIGSFCRITVSKEFVGHIVKTKNKINIKIDDNVDIGNNAFISANNDITIGQHTIMAPYVFITDHNHMTSDINKNLHQQPLTENGFVHIGKNVFIGTKVSILKNVEIGDHVTIGANSVVTDNIPSYSVAVGNPAKIISQYNFKTNKWQKV